MALFKINRGNSATLPSKMTDGWAYFCTDTGEFFIDYADSNGNLYRKQINADEAKKLNGYDIATILNNSEVEIPISSAVFAALSGKADTGHSHSISDVTNLQSTLDAKVPTARTINGKALSANISLSASDMNIYVQATEPSNATVGAIWIDTSSTTQDAEGVSF